MDSNLITHSIAPNFSPQVKYFLVYQRAFEIFTPGFSLSFLCPINTPSYLTTKHHTHDPIGPIGKKSFQSLVLLGGENDNDGIKIGLVGVKFHELYTTYTRLFLLL